MTPCTRERIVDALAPHLTGKDIAELAGWLCGLPGGRLSHLDALTLGECQHVMEQISNAMDVGLLVERYRMARRLERFVPTPEQEGAAWLR